MAILRTIQCDVCKTTACEHAANEGWPGWGSIQGVALNGASNPSLCPECLAKVMDFIDGGMTNAVD